MLVLDKSICSYIKIIFAHCIISNISSSFMFKKYESFLVMTSNKRLLTITLSSALGKK